MNSIGKANVYQQITELARVAGAVNLAQGIPEAMFDAEIADALTRSLGLSWQYTPVQGDLQLRRNVARYHGRETADSENVIITSGCTESLFCALVAARHRYGRKVCVLEPYYSYYPGLIELAGMEWEPVRLDLDNGTYLLDLDLIEQQITKGTRIFLLNAPHNPTGWAPNRSDAERIVEMCARGDMMIIFDSVYENFVYNDACRQGIEVLLAPRKNCIVAGSASKLLAASGLRLGWLIAPTDFVADALHVHMHSSNCQALPVQSAVSYLLERFDDDFFETYQTHYRQKRDLLAATLKELDLQFSLPDGGHFILANYPPDFGPPADHARKLITACGIAALPVQDFYSSAPPFALRFSFAVSKQDLSQAAANVKKSKSTVLAY